MRSMLGLVMVVGVGLALAPDARADSVVCLDGRRLEGRVERRGDSIIVHGAGGATTTVGRRDVRSVVCGASSDLGPRIAPRVAPRVPRPSPRRDERADARAADARAAVRIARGPAPRLGVSEAPPGTSAAPVTSRTVTADEVSTAQAAREEGLRRAGGRLAPRVERAPSLPLPRAVEALAACWSEGLREPAEALIAGHPGLVAWDDLPPGVTVDVVCARDACDVLITVRGGSPASPVAIAFPPGTYGEPLPGHGDGSQPRAFIEPPIVIADGTERTLQVRTLCADESAGPPLAGYRYALRRVERDGPAERLLRVLCAGEGRREPAAQSALWVIRNDTLLSPPQVEHVLALLLRSGVDPRGYRSFSGAPLPGRRSQAICTLHHPRTPSALPVAPAPPPVEAPPVETVPFVDPT